jgi:acetylornithine deacetylase/succinyl-diaminopimelate desuccinylase-like protein
MLGRTYALVATSKVILSIEEIAIKYGGFATVGVIECKNSSTNCVPAEIFFTIDIRNPTEEILDLMEQSIRAQMKELQENMSKLLFNIKKIWESPAARFKQAAVQCVRAQAQRRFGKSSVAELDSLAGHDSAMTNRCVPTAMIFVPSRDGISHSPEEHTSERQW